MSARPLLADQLCRVSPFNRLGRLGAIRRGSPRADPGQARVPWPRPAMPGAAGRPRMDEYGKRPAITLDNDVFPCRRTIQLRPGAAEGPSRRSFSYRIMMIRSHRCVNALDAPTRRGTCRSRREARGRRAEPDRCDPRPRSARRFGSRAASWTRRLRCGGTISSRSATNTSTGTRTSSATWRATGHLSKTSGLDDRQVRIVMPRRIDGRWERRSAGLARPVGPRSLGRCTLRRPATRRNRRSVADPPPADPSARPRRASVLSPSSVGDPAAGGSAVIEEEHVVLARPAPPPMEADAPASPRRHCRSAPPSRVAPRLRGPNEPGRRCAGHRRSAEGLAQAGRPAIGPGKYSWPRWVRNRYAVRASIAIATTASALRATSIIGQLPVRDT